MKKNLLTLSFLAAAAFAFAQDTYIGDKAVVKVQPNTLFYHGGNVKLASSFGTGASLTQVVKNEGNIKIQGKFENEISTNGAEFVNVWTDSNNFGQLIIKETSATVGNVAMERSLPNVEQIDEYIIALPFNSTVKDVYNSLTNYDFPGTITNTFSGNCAVNVRCDNRYTQSVFVWDNRETEFDAVVESDVINPANRYLLNTRANTTLKQKLAEIKTGLGTDPNVIKKIALSGTPANQVISLNLKSGLKNNSQSYESQTYSQWKNQLNNYSETYNSYIGNQIDANQVNGSLLFGKNLHRLANPYTSNLDLSNVSIADTWIKFNTNAGLVGPTQAYASALRFRVFKLANDFNIVWNPQTGNTSTQGSNTTFSAYLSRNTGSSATPYFWTGSPEALLIKPYETFYLDYYTVNRTGNGGSRIIDAEVNLGDKQKTFSQSFVDTNSNTGVFARGVRSASNNNVSTLLANESLQAKGLVTDFDFTQLEAYLSQNSILQGSAAYLLNANFMNTGADTSNRAAENPIFFYEETAEGDVLLNAETIANYFNSEDYIGKPLRLGFKNLNAGNEYQVNVNLYEYSILNKVNSLNLGRYYLLDKLTNTVSEVDASTQISFVADENINDRFEFYWNELPRTLSTEDLMKNTTYIFKDNNAQFVRFENNNTTANIEIFDVTGRSIQKNTNVPTASDFRLNLTNVPNVYVVVVTYKDGKVVTKKTINK
ncbi:T9SS type A sorting domain-containing protein [Faecalibacter sp. LW9]|uniref:T9SS type A sorting domain-containing protein n=1 Tax=Faecalibacter sp. LW9 TaxID=3103144 RepID=UPI002AFE9E8C|nr:T9SS type A sorting domain-containing protein [Faecalibacter sp. LW9]